MSHQDQIRHDDMEAVAVIGMDGRFPGADDVNAYWNNLVEARETIDRLEDDSLDASVPASLREQEDYVRVRGQMRDADRFDAAFFGISPREAEVLDPQQRVFLEMCWRALEDAGYAPGTHKALTGVFAGMSYNTYFNAHVAKHPDVLASYGDIPALVANEKDYLATRVAYKFDLRGPCINISTACSTSLVAVCHAFNSLLDYQCDLALAGGISVLCPQERGYLYQDGSIYSPDGHCRPFDADARGTVFSNGGGVVVLKRLSEALADGDTVHAVIRGAAMNNDGAGKVSFTAPGVEGQAEVIQMAQELAGVRPDEISYIEAHGTGTSLGDPIEIAALTRAFRLHSDRRGFCGVGSVKGNIGHLDVASGVAGLIKTVLALREKKLPATLHFRKPNPQLGLDDSPFFVVDSTCDWPEESSPRRAAVSSFGLGGTNAHVVLEEAPAQEESDAPQRHQLLVLSAKTETALEQSRETLAAWLGDHQDVNFSDIAYTLQRGRQAFEHRLAVPARDHAEAAEALKGIPSSRVRRDKAGDPSPAVFMFPGQGSQYAGMCAQIYRDEPLVRDIVDRCAEALSDVLDFDLRDIMFGRTDNADELLDETQYTQPALFVTEYALARLWMQWGVKPETLVGHSIGEFSAAALAGVFTPEDAVRVVAERGRLMQAQPSGSMLSVSLSEEDVAEHLASDVTLAAANAPGLCVLSGSNAAIARTKARLEAKEISCRVLRTSHAFHSPMMDPVVETFETFLRGIPLSPPSMKIVSTVTGHTLAADEAVDPGYWARQLREPVRFMRALQSARDAVDNACVLIEVGPGVAAATFATQTFADDADVYVVGSLGRRADSHSEYAALLGAAGRLWTQGMPLDWQAMHAGERRRRVPLPTYRFERTRYWLDSAPATATPITTKPERGGEKARVSLDDVPDAERQPVDERPVPEQIAALLTDVSGIPVDSTQYRTRFTELDLDSLFLTQFGQALKKRFGVNLRFRELLVEHDTVAAVAALIEKQRPAEPVPAATSATHSAAVPDKQDDGIISAKDSGVATRRDETLALTDRQQQYLDDVLRRYAWRTSGSKAFARTHHEHLADPRGATDVDPLLKEVTYPIVTQSSSGSHIQDVDGNGYIDLVNGLGANLLGHSVPAVTDAIRKQLRRGYEPGARTPLAGRVARLVQGMTGFERVAFCATGAEAVQAALRIARIATGRDKVVAIADDTAIAGDHGEILGYGSEAALRRIGELSGQLAAVLVEPVPASRPEKCSLAFLRRLKSTMGGTGAALIFDERISGFRAHPAGLQGLAEVRADIATYGQTLDGGLPLGVLAGTPRFMDALDTASFSPGTFAQHPLSLAATEAMLMQLQEAGPALQKTLDERTKKLVEALDQHCLETGAPVVVRRFSSWFVIDDSHLPVRGLLHCRLRTGGLHVLEGQACFLSAAHTDADLAQIARVFRDALDELRAAGFFEQERTTTEQEQQAESVAMADTSTDGASMPPAPGARLGRRPDGQPGWFVPDPERPGRYRELNTEVRTH